MNTPFRTAPAEARDLRWLGFAAIAGIQIAFVAWVTAGPSDGLYQKILANGFMDVSAAIATIFALLVAVRFRGTRLGIAWSFLLFGMALSVFAETSWSYQDLTRNEVPFPSVSDIGYAGAYLPVFLGLLLMPSAPTSGSGKLKLALDTLILISALLLVSWFIIIESILDSGDPALARALGVFYPFADLAVIFAAFVLVYRAAHTKSAHVLSLLAAGYTAFALSDMAYAQLTEINYEAGSYIDIGWLAGYSLISCAAIVRLDPAAAFQPYGGKPAAVAFWPSLLPYAAVAPLFALFIFHTSAGSIPFALAAGLLGVVSLVIVRQVVTIYENTRLNRELVDLAATLEYRVKDQTMQLLRRRSPNGEDGDAAGGRPSGADDCVSGLPALPRE